MWQLKYLGDVVSQFLFLSFHPDQCTFICNIHGNDALILGFKWHELHYWGMNRHMLDVKHSQILEIRQKLRGQAMHMNFTFYDGLLSQFWNRFEITTEHGDALYCDNFRSDFTNVTCLMYWLGFLTRFEFWEDSLYSFQKFSEEAHSQSVL